MDETQVKHVIEAALLAAGRPLPLDTLANLFTARASELDKETLKRALDALAEDYRDRGLELKEVASGYRIQIKSSMSDWLLPLWEERAPRYTRALLETLALIAYRQPITRAEIEEVRGVAVSSNIIRTLMERNWIRVVGHRDVPGKPAMFGTTKEFLDYFGLKKLEDLPPLADIKDGLPELHPQTDFIEEIESGAGTEAAANDNETQPDAAQDESPDTVATSESEEQASSAPELQALSEGAVVAVAVVDEDDEEEDEEDEEDDDEEDDYEDEEDEEESANFVVVEALTTYVEGYSEDLDDEEPRAEATDDVEVGPMPEGANVDAVGTLAPTAATAESAAPEHDDEGSLLEAPNAHSTQPQLSHAAAEDAAPSGEESDSAENEVDSDEDLSRVETG